MGIDEAGIQVVFPFICNGGKEHIFTGGFLCCRHVGSQVAQSCLTLCHPMDYRVCGILQGRILEGGAAPFSRGSSQPRN